MKNFAWYNSVEPKDYLFTFPESEDPDYRDTVTTVDNNGNVAIEACSLTITEVDSLEGVVAMDDTQFEAVLDYYNINNEASRIGKTPLSLPPPTR